MANIHPVVEPQRPRHPVLQLNGEESSEAGAHFEPDETQQTDPEHQEAGGDHDPPEE